MVEKKLEITAKGIVMSGYPVQNFSATGCNADSLEAAMNVKLLTDFPERVAVEFSITVVPLKKAGDYHGKIKLSSAVKLLPQQKTAVKKFFNSLFLDELGFADLFEI